MKFITGLFGAGLKFVTGLFGGSTVLPWVILAVAVVVGGAVAGAVVHDARQKAAIASLEGERDKAKANYLTLKAAHGRTLTAFATYKAAKAREIAALEADHAAALATKARADTIHKRIDNAPISAKGRVPDVVWFAIDGVLDGPATGPGDGDSLRPAGGGPVPVRPAPGGRAPPHGSIRR